MSIETPTLEPVAARAEFAPVELAHSTPDAAAEWLIDVRDVSKKYCRDLRRSLWYGVQDVAGATLGRAPQLETLRPSEFWAVRNVSLHLRKGEALGLLGRNGAGKSTLLKMIAGQRSLSSGTITVRGRMVAMTELGLGFNPALTGRENAYVNAAVHGIPRERFDRIIEDIIDFSGIREFIDSAVQTYSTGMRARLGFSVATHLSPDILVVDEVLAVGDLDFRRKCVKHILRYVREGGSVILVAHDPYLVQSICNRAVVLEKGEVIFEGTGIDGVNFHFKLGHKEQFTTLAEASERVLGDAVDEERRATQVSGASGGTLRRSPVALSKDQPVVVDDIEVVAVDGGPLHTGKPARVILHYRAIADASVTWGFTICTADLQTSIVSCPKGLEGDFSKVHAGEGTLEAVLPDFPLQPGVFAVRGGVGDAESLTGISIKGYVDSPSFFTVVPARVNRSENYKVMHRDVITCRVDWVS